VFEGLSLLHANNIAFRAYKSAHMFSLSCRCSLLVADDVPV
jgi:hypothetical protein